MFKSITDNGYNGFYQVVEFCLEDSTYSRAKHPQSDQSAFGKILSSETNTDYKDITDFIRWYCLPE